MPGPVFKGEQSAIEVRINPVYNAETKTTTFEREYRGSQAAVNGQAALAKAAGWDYRITNDDAVYSVFISQPVSDPATDELDRWEISTESVEKSLFELPLVVEAAEEYDELLPEGEPTYRKVLEDAAQNIDTFIPNDGVAPTVVKHLKAGVTGWQLDLVVLRRMRRIPINLASNYKLNLDTGLYIYSTGNLNVPAEVAFALPSTPADISTLFAWGWRKRAQRVDIVGQYIEQNIEMVFAPWSLLAYSTTNNTVDW